MNAASAREHVRGARALREMPRAKELFRQGRLSYSKMRELTRLVGVVDEGELCGLALEMTASQLARTVSTFRLLSGTRIRVLPERRYASQILENRMVRISVVLPAEDAALVDAAVEAAVRAGEVPDSSDGLLVEEPREFPRPDRVQPLLDVAAGYLEARLPVERPRHARSLRRVAAPNDLSCRMRCVSWAGSCRDWFSSYDLFMVSEEQIQKWADEAEAGYDPAELKRRGRGRPGRGAEPMQVVAVRLTAEELEALDAAAERQNLSRSEAIRAALAHYAA
ncbi:MAG: ribbon-helix-helix protein, CopG family [Propionibacteriaceae bacterium]